MKKLVMLLMVATTFVFNTKVANAIEQDISGHSKIVAQVDITGLDKKDDSEVINNDDRNTAYAILIEHMNALKALYDLTPDTVQRLDAVMYQANVYIANTRMTVGELKSYITKTKGDMDAAIGGAAVVGKTSNFLFLCNETPASNAVYGKSIDLTLSFINLGKEDVSDVVITPKVSTKASEWPFKIQNASDVRKLQRLPKAGTVEEAYAMRQNVTWSFVVSDDALTGTYPLTFHVQYYRNGNIEEADLTTYVNVTGKPGNGSLESVSDDDKKAVSTPRIIVTGFRTEPENVYAGDTFKLTLTVQNTSNETAVSNIQFDLKAALEGDDSKNSYEAFLPTSGSATIFVPSIGIGETTELEIEMTARNDLTQKPYVITVDAQYEDKDNNPFKASTNVSIPVKQQSRISTGDAEVMPSAIAVGEASNITFSVYNMGKTTLYNVQVSFDDPSVSGGNAFLGKIEPGGTGNVDITVFGNAPSETGMVNAIVSYEDEMGAVSSIEKELELYVYEPNYDEDYYAYDDMGIDEDSSKKSKKPLWKRMLPFAAAGIAVVIVVAVVIKKKKDEKRRRLELEDDED